MDRVSSSAKVGLVALVALATLLALSWRAFEEHRWLDLADLRSALFVALVLAAVLWVDFGSRARRSVAAMRPETLARFDTSFRAAIIAAEAEAHRLYHNYVGTEHILLGLLASPDGAAGRLVVVHGLDLVSAQGEVEKLIGRGVFPTEAIGLTPSARRSIEHAVEVADVLGDHDIHDRHLLIGLTMVEDGIAAGILTNAGIDLVELRRAAQRPADAVSA